jgi:hypothetical protein
MLTDREIDLLLPDFPDIKLSYENITHNKVFNAEITIAIPEGTKCFAWFTHYKNKNVCLIMELNAKRNIIRVKRAPCCFRSDISYGTILYGTIFIYAQTSFFTMEDIFYYKGKNVSHQTWIDKFVLFSKIMKHDIKQVAYNDSFVVFGMPLYSEKVEDIENKVKTVPYKIESIQYRLYNKTGIYLYTPYETFIKNKRNPIEQPAIITKPIITKPTQIVPKQIPHKRDTPCQKIKPTKSTFIVRPAIQNDIYYLYCKTNKNDEPKYYDVAHIPNFTSSVLMNKLFRNIKENDNLDKLEESDDEEEFENEKEDRFVNMDKTYNMACSYNYKFKKWSPLYVSKSNVNIITENELLSFCK